MEVAQHQAVHHDRSTQAVQLLRSENERAAIVANTRRKKRSLPDASQHLFAMLTHRASTSSFDD